MSKEKTVDRNLDLMCPGSYVGDTIHTELAKISPLAPLRKDNRQRVIDLAYQIRDANLRRATREELAPLITELSRLVTIYANDGVAYPTLPTTPVNPESVP